MRYDEIDTLWALCENEPVARDTAARLPHALGVQLQSTRMALQAAFFLRRTVIERGPYLASVPDQHVKPIVDFGSRLLSELLKANATFQANQRELRLAATNGRSAHQRAIRFASRVALSFHLLLKSEGGLSNANVRRHGDELLRAMLRIEEIDPSDLEDEMLTESWRAAEKKTPEEWEQSLNTRSVTDLLSEIFPADDSSPKQSPRKPRPACNRDHLFLKWRDGEGLGPAKIRDRWNSLPIQERRRICLDACSEVASGKRGADVVKKAIAAARKERESSNKI